MFAILVIYDPPPLAWRLHLKLVTVLSDLTITQALEPSMCTACAMVEAVARIDNTGPRQPHNTSWSNNSSTGVLEGQAHYCLTETEDEMESELAGKGEFLGLCP